MYRLYTHNDLDGVGCGIVARLAFGNDVEIRYHSVTGIDFQVERYLDRFSEKNEADDFLFITDLSIHEENARRINEMVRNGGKLKLIDHHKTALHFNEFDWGMVRVHYDDGRLASATSLFYEYLLSQRLIYPSDSLHEFVELVRQYDTWEWDENNNMKAKHLNDLFFMGSIEEFEDKIVERIQNSRHFEFDEFEKKLLEMEEEKIGRYLRRKKREVVQTFIHNLCAGIVHAESYHSELGNELGKENPHLDYIAIMNMGGKKISFRTIHDHIDVSEIADRFGGGGHQKAAGCTLTEEAYRLYIAETFHIEPMRADAFKNLYNLKGTEYGVLYENRNEEKFFVYKLADENWVIEKDGEPLSISFTSYENAERHIKREYAAWLARDEQYVEYLKNLVIKEKRNV